MNIRKPKTIKPEASALACKARQLPRILLIYCGILAGLSVVVTAVSTLADARMATAGGLGNLGTRSILSTIQTLLPIVNMLLVLGLDLGLSAVLLRVSRGQYVCAQTLRTGISRFFPMLRLSILQGLIYGAIALVSMYAASFVFFLTPWGMDLIRQLMPLAASAGDPYAMMDAMLNDPQLMALMEGVMGPVYLIWIPLALALILPVHYRLRVSTWVLLDDPRAGAFKAVFESMRMTRRNCTAFFKLDLSYWWYYGLLALASAVSYGSLLFAALGIPLPWGSDVSPYIFYALYLIAEAAITYFFRPRVEVSAMLIYDVLRPKPQPQNQVVLGNIFQM